MSVRLLHGRWRGRAGAGARARAESEITFYKAMGIAMEDVVAALLVVEGARQPGGDRPCMDW